MVNDIIKQYILDMDNNSRDNDGHINYDNKLTQLVSNMIDDSRLSPVANETYLEYDKRLSRGPSTQNPVQFTSVQDSTHLLSVALSQGIPLLVKMGIR